MTLTIKLDRNWSSFQLANSAPPLSVTDSAIAPSARICHNAFRTGWKGAHIHLGACSDQIKQLAVGTCGLVGCSSEVACAHADACAIFGTAAKVNEWAEMPILYSGDHHGGDPV